MTVFIVAYDERPAPGQKIVGVFYSCEAAEAFLERADFIKNETRDFSPDAWDWHTQDNQKTYWTWATIEPFEVRDA